MNNTFDDICRELATELEAATDAVVTPVLGPKRPGRGVAAVRERIAAEFERIRADIAQTLVTQTKISTPTLPKVGPSCPRKPLSEMAEPILHVAERRYANVPARLPRHIHRCYHICTTTQTYEEILAEAMKGAT